MIIVQINGVCGIGSTGKIVQEISEMMDSQGIENYVFYGQGKSSYLLSRKIGNNFNIKHHQLFSRLTGKHGLYSKNATNELLEYLREIKPEIIHLHNIHGFYLNFNILFKYLSESKIKVVWTLHDCWSFTGHCAYFDYVCCEKWKIQCEKCPNKNNYPISWLIDRSRQNYIEKKDIFNSVNITLVTPSLWLNNLLKDSFLKNHNSITINNGINLQIFKPTLSNFRMKYNLKNKFIILCIAANLEKRKGVEYMFELANLLDNNFQVVLLGATEKQLKLIPKNIIGLKKTSNINDLVDLYSMADVYFNPTLEDNFPTTNLESLACGTPIITFNTGGSPESINDKCGIVVEKGDIDGIMNAILKIKKNGKEFYKINCRKESEDYDKNLKYMEYLNLYKFVLRK